MKRHLYLVLDEHKDGFSIHKLELGDHNDNHPDGSSARRLPEPPFLRVTFPTLGERAQFAAVGSSMPASSPQEPLSTAPWWRTVGYPPTTHLRHQGVDTHRCASPPSRTSLWLQGINGCREQSVHDRP
jgi:hypothetical protein